MPLWLLLLALFFLNSTVLVFHVLYIYIFFRINLHCSLLRFVSFSYLQLPSSLSPLEHFSNRRFCNRQGEGNRNRHSDSKGSTPEMTPRGAGAVPERRARWERPGLKTGDRGELCKQMILSPSAALPHHPSPILPTLHTEETQNLNSDRVRATPKDTVARKDLGQCSATVSYTLLESELFPPPLLQATLGKKKRKQRRVGWGGDVARWSQRL